MTTTTKALLTSLSTIMAEYKTLSPKTDRARQLQLGGTVVKTAKAIWSAAGAEMATLTQPDIAEIETAYDAAKTLCPFCD